MSAAAIDAVAAVKRERDVTAERVPALTGVRALAAGWVLLYHAWLVAGSPAVTLPLPGASVALTGVFATGWLGVDLFFVLSGFVLTWQAAQLAGSARHFDVGGFLARRVLRVYPAYYGCLTVLLALAWLGVRDTSPGSIDLALHLVMMHNATSDTVVTINSVFWSLPFEWQFYLLFPAMLWLAGRSGPMAIVALSVVVAAAWRWLALAKAPSPGLFVGPVVIDVLAQLPFRIDEFAIGMGAAFVAPRVRFASTQARVVAGIGAAALAALVAWCTIANIKWWQPDVTPFVRLPWMALSSAVLLIGLARSETLLTRAFAAKPVVWLGEISYSIYLWHFPLLVAIGVPFATPGTSAGLATVIVVGVPATLMLSALSYYAIERPFLHASIWGASRTRKIGVLALWAVALLGWNGVARG